MRNIRINLLLIIGLILFVSPISAQIVFDQPASGGGKMIFNHWSIKDSTGTIKLNQFVIPIYGFLPMEDNFEMRFSVASISSKLEQSGTDYKLSGLGDIRVQLNRSFSNDQFLLSLGLNLPMGKTELNKADERPVMEYLSKDYLDLPVRRYGEGMGVNLLAGTAAQVGQMQLGASLSFALNGAYTAYEDGGDFNPGNMFSITAGLDAPYNNMKLSGRFSYSAFGTDEMDDKKIFKAGQQLTMQIGVINNNDKLGFSSNIIYIARGRSTSYESTEEIKEKLRIYGNEFAWINSVSWVPAENYYVIPSLEMKFIGANEYDFDNSSLFGFGSAFGRRFKNDIDANIGFKYFTGTADGGDIDLSGFQISFGLSAAFR